MKSLLDMRFNSSFKGFVSSFLVFASLRAQAQKIAPPLGGEKTQRNQKLVDELFESVPQNSIDSGVLETTSDQLGWSDSIKKGSQNNDPETRRKQFNLKRTDSEISGETADESKSAERLRELDKQMGLEVPLLDNLDKRIPSFLLGVKSVKANFGSKNFEDALFELNGLLKHYPKSHVLFTMKGTVALRMNQFDLALKCYKRAYSFEPSVRLKLKINALERKIQERNKLKQEKEEVSEKIDFISNEFLKEEAK